jgi:hypothetical protein
MENKKVIVEPRKTTQTKVGYVTIYRTSDYGGRVRDETDIIYENRADCEADTKDDPQFLAVGTLTWEE